MFGGSGLYAPERYKITRGDGSVWTVHAEHGLEKIEDRFGNTITISDAGILASNGPDVTFTRDAEGRITQMDFSDGVSRVYDYTSGDLDVVTDQNGKDVTFTYAPVPAPEHLLQGWQGESASGPAVTVTYDADGRVERVVDGSGVEITEDWSLTPGSLSATHVSPSDEVIAANPDQAHLQLTTTEFYGDDGTLTQVDQTFVPYGETDTVTYTTSYTYDEDYKVDGVILPTGATEEFDYDDSGRVVREVAATGVETTTSYGPYDVVETKREGGVLTTDNDVDPDGNIVGNIDGEQYSYTPSGQLDQVHYADGQWVDVEYSDSGLPTNIFLHPGDGSTPREVVVTHYPGSGRLWTVTSPRSAGTTGTKQLVYDGEGRIVEHVDERGMRQVVGYDEFGRRVSYRGKLQSGSPTTSPAVLMSYDSGGRLLTMENREGEVLHYSYDVSGNVSAMQGPGVDQRFEHDALGRRVVAEVVGVHAIERSYDEAGLSSEHSWSATLVGVPDQTLEFTRDPAGRIVRSVGERLDVATEYDADRDIVASVHVESVQNSSALGTYALEHDGQGRLRRIDRPNSTSTSWAYDPRGRVSQILTSYVGGTDTTDTASADVRHQRAYGYDAWGLPDLVDDSLEGRRSMRTTQLDV
jgi:YD repeat-containing protein